MDEQIKLFDDTQSIEQEIAICTEREYERTKDPSEDASYIKNIKNRHEGYGHIAECIVQLEYAMKSIKGDMKDFLERLSNNDDLIVRDIGGQIYGHATQLAMEAVRTSAVAKRIIYDILVDDEQLPIEAVIADGESANNTEGEVAPEYDEAEANE